MLLKTLALASLLAAADASLRVTLHKAGDDAAPAHGAKAFAKVAHLKATPWDADPAAKKVKCDDLCLLQGFYTFQEGRNCYTRPTDLCMQYKLGRVAAETVIVTAECTCPTDSSAVDSTDGSDDASDGGDEVLVEISA